MLLSIVHFATDRTDPGQLRVAKTQPRPNSPNIVVDRWVRRLGQDKTGWHRASGLIPIRDLLIILAIPLAHSLAA